MEVRYPPPQKGYLSDTCAIRYENKANGCDTPLCDTISKRYCAIWGGISHWAATFLESRTSLWGLVSEIETSTKTYVHISFCRQPPVFDTQILWIENFVDVTILLTEGGVRMAEEPIQGVWGSYGEEGSLNSRGVRSPM